MHFSRGNAMTASKYLNTVLTVLTVLLGLNLWTGMHQSPAAEALDPATSAYAQGGANPAAQRQAMIDELKSISTSMDALNTKLDNVTNRNQVRVEVTEMPDGD